MRGALGPNGQLFQLFNLGGAVRAVEVGGEWTSLLGEIDSDGVMVRVPIGSKRVLVRTSADYIEGVAATAEDALTSWPLDPGVHPFGTDRAHAGPRFYLAVDPTDTDPDSVSPLVHVMAAG